MPSVHRDPPPVSAGLREVAREPSVSLWRDFTLFLTPRWIASYASSTELADARFLGGGFLQGLLNERIVNFS